MGFSYGGMLGYGLLDMVSAVMLDALWAYKNKTVRDTGRRHTGRRHTGKGHTGEGHTRGSIYEGYSGWSDGGYTGDGLYVGHSGKGGGYGGSYRGYDETGDGEKQVVETMVYRNCGGGKEFLLHL